MKKAKTTQKLIPFLSAIISVVFAFIIGYTYCYNIMAFEYGTNKKSTQAYLGNQQYVLINDASKATIPYSPGVHATEISLQYAIDYDFDLRIRYSLDWLGDEELEKPLSTNNVELLFVNRDNVIVDDEYIYYINYTKEHQPAGLPAGTGEINLIAGVEIVDSLNKDYLNKTLKITINEDDIRIYKSGVQYDENHVLYSDMKHEVEVDEDETEIVYRESAKAWYAHKTNTTDKAFIMVYNHRYNSENGISSPGHNSAYSKVNNESVITASWIGGNRAFAGVGLYVITGAKPLTLNTKVSGTWRNVSGTSLQQYDNSIRFNYSVDWLGNTYDENNLFEYKDYNYVIPAYTACYINVVDSVEITTAGGFDVADLDTYRLVVSEVLVNETELRFDSEDYSRKINSVYIECPTILETETRENYESKAISIFNSSKYANNLYEFVYGNAYGQEYNNDKVVLVNNSSTKQQVTVNYGINFYVSNGGDSLEIEDGDVRADSFDDDAYFREDKNVKEVVDLGVEITHKVPGIDGQIVYTIAPYSSIEIKSNYSLGNNFQTYLASNFGGYDAWVELDVTCSFSESAAVTSDLLVEMSITKEGNGTIQVKNTSNDVVKSISVDIELYVRNLVVAESVSVSPIAPNDWEAKFWTYYRYNNESEEYVQNESKTWVQNELFSSKYGEPEAIELTEISTGNKVNGVYSCVNKEVTLKPNECLDLLTFTFTKSENEKIISSELQLQSSAKADSADLLTATKQDSEELEYPAYSVIKGVDNKYILNNSNTSCFIRFNESSASNETLANVVKDGDYYYYTFIVRPGQILETTSTVKDIEVLPAPDSYSSEYLTDKEWGSVSEDGEGVVIYSSFVQAINNIFD